MANQAKGWVATGLLLLLVGGCGKKPPRNLPPHFEGNVVIDMGNVESLSINWTQTGAQLKGTYSYGEFKGKDSEVLAESAGDQVDLTLKVPEAAQKNGMPEELKCTLTVGNVSAEEVHRRYQDVFRSHAVPDYLKAGSPPLVQLGGFLDFKVGDKKFHRIINLTNCTVIEDLTRTKP